MNTPDGGPAPQADLSGAIWRTSRYSSANGSCVEVAFTDGIVAVRDSKDPSQSPLIFHPAHWDAFLSGTTGDGPDHP